MMTIVVIILMFGDLSQTQTLPTTTNTTHLKDILRAATPSQAKLINLY